MRGAWSSATTAAAVPGSGARIWERRRKKENKK
jgi:hypothetical protein